MKRQILVLGFFLLSMALAKGQDRQAKDLLSKQRLVIIMFDGFGMNYYHNAPMPFVKSIEQKGFFKEVNALMPTVTNLNNASICTGTFPDRNGITGNSFLDDKGQEEYMENKSLLMAPTLFQSLKRLGIRSALVSSKKKSIALLSGGTSIALSAETADSTWTARLGKAPGIYSADVNYWTMQAALYILKTQKDVRCLYIHTTDYPMHMWTPRDSSSLEHLAKMDRYIAEITQVAPDAMILVTADHDLNHKDHCVDIENTLARKGVKVKMAISAERDKYLKHHRGFGGTSYVYLEHKGDEARVHKSLQEIKGIKTVMSRQEAARKHHLMPGRIGDLVVFADSLTVFGNLDDKEEEQLPPSYRTHGSEYELRVPLLIYNAPKLPPASYFQYNKDLAGWLFRRD